MRPYETLFFTEPNISEEAIDSLVSRVEGAITKFGGKIDRVNRWGKRMLTYPVEKHSEGFYVLIDFHGNKEDLKELERFYLINQNVLRFMTTSRHH